MLPQIRIPNSVCVLFTTEPLVDLGDVEIELTGVFGPELAGLSSMTKWTFDRNNDSRRRQCPAPLPRQERDVVLTLSAQGQRAGTSLRHMASQVHGVM